MQQYSLKKGFNLPEPVFAALTALNDADFFSDGLLVGSWAMLFYQELFGIEYVLRTDDIDFALKSDAAKGKTGADLETALAEKGFDPVIDLLSGGPKGWLYGEIEEFVLNSPIAESEEKEDGEKE